MTSEFVKALPNIFGRHAEYPADMIGATIIRMGFIADEHVDGGGLVIDYLPAGEAGGKRVTFAFCETGMWVDSVKTAATGDCPNPHGGKGVLNDPQ